MPDDPVKQLENILANFAKHPQQFYDMLIRKKALVTAKSILRAKQIDTSNFNLVLQNMPNMVSSPQFFKYLNWYKKSSYFSPDYKSLSFATLIATK